MKKFDELATNESINNVTARLKENGINSFVLERGNEALQKIVELIPQGVSIMNGSSVTLETIGFVEYLKSGKHSWNNLHEAIVNEKDKAKQEELRKQALLSDYYLGSVHAVSEEGE